MTPYPTYGISLVLFLTLPLVGRAETLTGRVVKIADGDTVTVLDDRMREHRVRMVGIDAPESDQPFGKKSRESLSKRVAGRQVQVLWEQRDRYDRLLGKVIDDGQDINLAQVSDGLAWWYWQYADDQSWVDRVVYATSQTMAWLGNVGLWADPHPVPPWEWRKR